MTDFEDALRESLTNRADHAPTADGLAQGARRRLRRRRTTMAGAGVLAGAVIVAPFLLNQSDSPSRGVDGIATDPPSPTAVERTDGLRTESWHDVTFEVPEDWGYGVPTGQCLSSASVPSVGRPDDLAPSVDCAGPGYGATIGASDPASYFQGSGDVWAYEAPEGFDPLYPDKSWVSTWYDDEVAVTIVTPQRRLTEQIAESVRVIEDVDGNGCAPLLGFAESSTADGSEGLSVCRYDENDDLEWSRHLDSGDAQGLRDLVAAAPERTVDYDCPTEDGLGRFALLDGGAYVASVVTGATCVGNGGVFLAGAVREVTPELSAALER